ncbi:hypothetical protein R3P38DRAFT_1678659 [Favolaschia claudopus]|uniref:Uncharacterized protein n=1 Tax=Favolaschia claudopus TaxID=2862362 RepID=A0AAW0ACR4_9AGAR
MSNFLYAFVSQRLRPLVKGINRWTVAYLLNLTKRNGINFPGSSCSRRGVVFCFWSFFYPDAVVSPRIPGREIWLRRHLDTQPQLVSFSGLNVNRTTRLYILQFDPKTRLQGISFCVDPGALVSLGLNAALQCIDIRAAAKVAYLTCFEDATVATVCRHRATQKCRQVLAQASANTSPFNNSGDSLQRAALQSWYISCPRNATFLPTHLH